MNFIRANQIFSQRHMSLWRNDLLTKFNRFAIFPKMCNSCHRYIFLEKYRRADVFHHFADVPNGHPFWKENICRECIKKYS